VHAGKELLVQRNSLDGFHEAVKIRQRSGHLLDDGSESTLVLRMTPAGIVSTTRFVVEQSDLCQVFHPGSGWISRPFPHLRLERRLIGPDSRSSFRPSAYTSPTGLENLQSTPSSRLIYSVRGP
jgi:hypothetical protein